MDVPNKKVANKLLSKLYDATHDETIQARIASLKAEFENLGISSEMFVEERVKAPISSIRKYTNSEKYQTEWNKIKDLIGLMVVVDNNDQVDKVISYIEENYADKQNPNSRFLYEDFRKKSVRDEAVSPSKYISQDPTGRPYQTNDGYKNVRANIMINDYPIEIQIKTQAQYIAHFATHDPVYKSPIVKSESERHEIADKLFPYFEAYAYLRLNRDKLSNEEITKVEEDIQEIYLKNYSYYARYPSVFNNACAVYGVYFYMLKHREEILSNSIFNSENLNSKLSVAEIERVFKYTLKQTQRSNPSLNGTQALSQTIDQLTSMSYPQFKQIKDSIAGEYRLGTCLVTGVFDILRQNDIKFIQALGNSFKNVMIGVYDDELAEAYLGHKPIFSQELRCKQLSNCKGVSSTFNVSSGFFETSEPIGSLEFAKQTKPFAIGYLSGVFDGFHPGHRDHLEFAIKQCEKVYVGVKSDNYVIWNKNKTSIVDENERLSIISGQRGIADAYVTDKDITPSAQILEEMEQAMKDGKECAIFMGSDWFDEEKRAQKLPTSLKELEDLKQNYPEITLTTTPRPTGEQRISSSSIREQLIRSFQDGDTNPYEITNMGEEELV